MITTIVKKITQFSGLGFSLLILSTIGLPNQAEAQRATGSHVFAVSSPVHTIRFTEPGEITQIRILLENKQATKAVELARGYLRTFEFSRPNWGTSPYYAHIALCSALTMKGELDEAVDTCDKAVENKPNDWQAINNRGTAHMIAGNLESALKDYKRALELEPDSGDITRVIQHNLSLVSQRMGDD